MNILDVAQHIVNDELDPPLKALFIYNHNPVAVHPRQKLLLEALRREDLFTVGYDLTMTDSMAYADIVLPACSSMEYGDLYKAYGHAITQRSAAVIPAVGESRKNTRVFSELAAIFSFDEPEFQETDQQMLAKAVLNLPAEGGLLDRTEAHDTTVVFRDVPPGTPTKKAMLFNADEEARAGLGLPQYRLLGSRRAFTLVSPSSDKRTNSTFGGTAANRQPYRVELCADDARNIGLVDGQKVKLVNDQAEIVLDLLISDRVKSGVAYVPKGAWCADSDSGLTINALVPGHKADMADGACYNDTQIDILSA
ncbi:MAG: anaerobic selenocysteine-containing dehydrogenase [Halieaceae bacterium]